MYSSRLKDQPLGQIGRIVPLEGCLGMCTTHNLEGDPDYK